MPIHASSNDCVESDQNLPVTFTRNLRCAVWDWDCVSRPHAGTRADGCLPHSHGQTRSSYLFITYSFRRFLSTRTLTLVEYFENLPIVERQSALEQYCICGWEVIYPVLQWCCGLCSFFCIRISHEGLYTSGVSTQSIQKPLLGLSQISTRTSLALLPPPLTRCFRSSLGSR